ncbi:MAG: DUF4468 domain-containing protein [Bacteroidales bacterium]|jgi:hypothetical protein
MNKLAVLFFVFISFQIHAQTTDLFVPVDSVTQLIKFQNVVDEEGDQYELFKRCIYWVNDYYKDPVRVTSERDQVSGRIIGHSRFRIYYYGKDSVKHIGGMINYTFTIEMKDNRYRYTIDELVLKSQTNIPVEKWLNKNDPAYDPRWDSYLKQIADYVNNWGKTLEEKMKPEKEKVEDTW